MACRAASLRRTSASGSSPPSPTLTSAASYGEMTVEDVIGVAGVSRRTFYEHFKNKEEAFLAAYDAVVEQLLRSVVDGPRAPRPPSPRA